MSETIGNNNDIPHQITLEEIGRGEISETLEQLKEKYKILAHNRDMADEDWDNNHRRTTWDECCRSNDHDPVELENLRKQIEELEKTKSSLPDEIGAIGMFEVNPGGVEASPTGPTDDLARAEIRARHEDAFDLRRDLTETWEDFCKRHSWNPEE